MRIATAERFLGSAPAPGAVSRASRLTLRRELCSRFNTSPRHKCSVRGAPNGSRGGCAPHGFTLIELLVVIAIIGILASLSMVVIARVRQQGRVTEARRQIQALVNAINEYHSDTGTFPISGGVRTIALASNS
ncbi:MAG TPA: type II secretion system protein, partial [Verrucomicrobiae bacterium]